VLNLTSPFTPMLFMGEEFAASTPWQFFTSHPEPELGEATSAGRLREFERMGWDPDLVPDPQAESTFTNSKLDWSEPERGDHARLLALYKDLIALRRQTPELTDPEFASVQVEFDQDHGWFILRRGRISVCLNFADRTCTVDAGTGRLLLATEDEAKLDGVLTLPPNSAAIIRGQG